MLVDSLVGAQKIQFLRVVALALVTLDFVAVELLEKQVHNAINSPVDFLARVGPVQLPVRGPEHHQDVQQHDSRAPLVYMAVLGHPPAFELTVYLAILVFAGWLQTQPQITLLQIVFVERHKHRADPVFVFVFIIIRRFIYTFIYTFTLTFTASV